MTLNNSFDHLNNTAAKYLSKDLYSAIFDNTNNTKNVEEQKMLNIDSKMNKSKPSLANSETINEIVRNLFTTSKMCDHIYEDKEGPPSSEKFDFNSELEDLTVRAGANSESFN